MQQFYRGRRVLITGHTGFKGSWLSVLLMLWGANVYGYSLEQRPTDPSMFTLLDLASHMEQDFGDVRDRDSLKQAMRKFQPELVIHMAAQPIVVEGFRDPQRTFETNI
ncbi:MAG: GDP-mannose 4,6-dehydratase, partial [Sulfobacillus sp.]